MKQLNLYITEKLKLNKDIDNNSNISIVDAIKDIFDNDILKAKGVNEIIPWYKVEEENKEIIIHLPDTARLQLKKISDYLKEQLIDKSMTFDKIEYNMRESKIIISL